jgi:hypothetical protein
VRLVLAALAFGLGLDAACLCLMLRAQSRQAAAAWIQETDNLPRPTGLYRR